MPNLFSWLLDKLKQREEKKQEKLIAKVFTPEKFHRLEQLAGISIKDKSQFIQALMHRSFLEQNTEFKFSNERLEFLGDSVLSLVVAEYLFDAFPEKDEGFLTKIRAKLVNRLTLAEAAEKIKLQDFLLISKNLSHTFLNGSQTVLCDALEAFIGAIYLEGGLEASSKFIYKTIIAPNIKEGVYLIDENYKSQLLEYAQANHMEIPTYIVVREEGPQHNRIFTIKVTIGREEFGVGKGRNKKSAEQNAAHAAMKLIASSSTA